MTQKVLSYSDIYEKLFNKSSGACCMLDVMNNTDISGIVQNFKIIEDIWSVSENIRLDKEMIKIYENFINWGCKFSTKLIVSNILIDMVDILMDFMTLMYDFLPVASVNISMFDNQTLMVLYSKLKKNCHESPILYIKIFSKLWLFCEKEIVNENLICTIMIVLCELMRDNKLNDVVGNLFEYSGTILKLYVDQLGHKINNILVVNKCITLVQVVVRSEKHAIGRLFFWWQLICSTRKEIFRKMIDICLIPFLANLFGKHITFEKTEVFNYTAGTYNCFTHYDELGPLCHFVMSHLLQTIARGAPTETVKLSKKLTYLGHLDNDLFVDTNILVPFMNRFLAAFYFWCQLGEKISETQPFQLLDVIFKSIAQRFSLVCDEVSSKKVIKDETKTLEISLYNIVNVCCEIKKLLEEDLSHLNRSASVVFTEHTTLMSSMVKSLGNGATMANVENGYIVTQNLLLDNLHTMKKLITASMNKKISISNEISGQWQSNSQILIDFLFPSDSPTDRNNLAADLLAIVDNWFSPLSDEKRNQSILVGADMDGIWLNNMHLWCFVALKIYNEFEKDNFNLNRVRECSDLKPFIDFLQMPMFFIQKVNQDFLNITDFDHICSIHENLYHIFALKATLIPCLNSNEWCSELCNNLNKQLSRSNKHSLLLNFTVRFIRSIVYYCDSIETTNDIDNNYKDNTLWSCVSALDTFYPMLDTSNIRLTLKNENKTDNFLSKDFQMISKKMEKISKHLQSSSDVDTDFSLGLALHATERVIFKLGHNPRMVFEAITCLFSKMSQIIDVCIRKKETASTRLRQKTKTDKDFLTIENMMITLLTHIKIICGGIDMSSALNPIFSIIFSFPSGKISQSTMNYMVDYWNEEIIKYQNNVEFTKEFIATLKNANKLYPNLTVPGQSKEFINIIPEIKENLTDDSSRKKKKESFLSKIKNDEQLKKAEKTKESGIFIAPKKGRPKKIQAYTLKRQISDADYTIVASPPPVKRSRLTEHQKEVLCEQRNNLIPSMYIGFDNAELPKLVSQDSDLSNFEVEKIDCNNIPVSPILIDSCCNDVSMSVDDGSITHINVVTVDDDCNMDCIEIVNNITEVRTLENVKDNEEKVPTLSSNSNNNDMAILHEKHILMPLKENKITSVDDKVADIDISNTSVKYIDASDNDAESPNIKTVEEFKRKPLLDRNPYLNSVRSPSVTGRTQRMVQMALQNHLKRKDDTPKNSQFTMNSEGRSGIMRHTWSESKKDAKVSFSVPLVHSKSEESLIDKDSEELIPETYLSPVFDRRAPTKKVSPTIYDLDLNDDDSLSKDFPVTVQSPRMFSVTCSDSRSAEKVRQSMESLEELSPIKIVKGPVVKNKQMRSMDQFMENIMAMDAEETVTLENLDKNDDDSLSQDYPVTVQSPRMFSVTCSDSRSAEKVRQSMESLEELSPIKIVKNKQISSMDQFMENIMAMEEEETVTLEDKNVILNENKKVTLEDERENTMTSDEKLENNTVTTEEEKIVTLERVDEDKMVTLEEEKIVMEEEKLEEEKIVTLEKEQVDEDKMMTLEEVKIVMEEEKSEEEKMTSEKSIEDEKKMDALEEPLLLVLDSVLIAEAPVIMRQVDTPVNEEDLLLDQSIKVIREALRKADPGKISEILDALFKI